MRMSEEELAALIDKRKPKVSKYGNVKTVIDGITFASKREGARYQELKLMERAGEIDLLMLQPKFRLDVNGEKICTYVADFQYDDLRTDKTVVEDAKGMKTPVYQIKKKLVKAIFGIEIVEV